MAPEIVVQEISSYFAQEDVAGLNVLFNELFGMLGDSTLVASDALHSRGPCEALVRAFLRVSQLTHALLHSEVRMAQALVSRFW